MSKSGKSRMSCRGGAARRPLLLNRFACLILMLIVQGQAATGQDWGAQGNESFSSRMRGGSREIPLLSLPASLDRDRGVLNRSLGGISGSSFQTENATPEQTLRTVLKAPRETAFNAAPPAFHLLTGGQESLLGEYRAPFLESLETHFGSASSSAVESFRVDSSDLEKSLKLLLRHERRGSLEKLLENP